MKVTKVSKAKTKILIAEILDLSHLDYRYSWAKNTTDILACWVKYFGCPTCALLMMLIHEEQYKTAISNNGRYTLCEPFALRAISERTGIPISTVHRKMKKILADPIFEIDGGFFGFAKGKDGGYLIADELPHVKKCIENLINTFQNSKSD